MLNPPPWLDAAAIARLVPHQGAMCLLDAVLAWTATSITCRATSHLSPANPLRHANRLGLLAGAEYAMQAAALHGGLLAASQPQKPAYLATLRDVGFGAHRHLDDPAIGALRIDAWLEHSDAAGFIYRFDLASAAGEPVIAGRAVIATIANKASEAVLF